MATLTRCAFAVIFLFTCSLSILAQLSSEQSQTTSLGRLPLVFEPNQGQSENDVQFLARGNAYTVLLKQGKAIFMFSPEPTRTKDLKGNQPSSLTLELLHSNDKSKAGGLDLLPGKSNYFIGKHPSDWHVGISQFGKVTFKSIYPGIDVVYHGSDGELEYDFVLAPNSDPAALNFRVSGMYQVLVEEDGGLCIHASAGTVTLHKPVIYQDIAGMRHQVEGKFVLRAGNEVGFDVGTYDRKNKLVIDPVLSYSTLISGTNQV
jgi:hypothetical protein